MPELFHPVIGKFIHYTGEEVEWLEGGNEISYHTGSTVYKLRKIEDENVLYVHGVGHVPLDLEEDVPELELDEVDDLLTDLNPEEEPDADDFDPFSHI